MTCWNRDTCLTVGLPIFVVMLIYVSSSCRRYVGRQSGMIFSSKEHDSEWTVQYHLRCRVSSSRSSRVSFGLRLVSSLVEWIFFGSAVLKSENTLHTQVSVVGKIEVVWTTVLKIKDCLNVSIIRFFILYQRQNIRSISQCVSSRSLPILMLILWSEGRQNIVTRKCTSIQFFSKVEYLTQHFLHMSRCRSKIKERARFCVRIR